MKEPVTKRAQRIVAEVVAAGERVGDATAGNGHDTVFLAELVGAEGGVAAFDIQRAAIDSTRRRLEERGLVARVDLFCESHGKMLERIERGSLGAVMFNLGYLPGGDHAVITQPEETLRALEQALLALRPGGVMAVVCYPGHTGGAEEARAVAEFARRRGGEVFPEEREDAPFLVVFRRDVE